MFARGYVFLGRSSNVELLLAWMSETFDFSCQIRAYITSCHTVAARVHMLRSTGCYTSLHVGGNHPWWRGPAPGAFEIYIFQINPLMHKTPLVIWCDSLGQHRPNILRTKVAY